MSASMLQHLVRPTSACGRSGLMSLNLTRTSRPGTRPGSRRVSFGVETQWNQPFNDYQISTAPPGLQVILKSDSVWLVPGSSEDLNKTLRERGFAATTYTLEPAEKAWLVGMLPADKAAAWKASPSMTCTMVVCAGTVKESTGLSAWWYNDTVGSCVLGEGLKIEDVAPVKGGSVVSSLSTVVGSALSAIYEWVVPSALKNVAIVSSTRDATPEEKAKAATFLQSYDAMAASVTKVERLVSLGATLTRAQAVQLQISKVHLGQNANIAAQVRKSAGGTPGSPNRATMRARVKRERSEQFGVFGLDDAVVVCALICVSVVAASIAAAYIVGKVSDAYTKQSQLENEVTNDLLAKCSDASMPADLRKEVCHAVAERTSYKPTDWSKLAKWVGLGAVSVAGAVVVTRSLSVAKPAIDVAIDRTRGRFGKGKTPSKPALQGR